MHRHFIFFLSYFAFILRWVMRWEKISCSAVTSICWFNFCSTERPFTLMNLYLSCVRVCVCLRVHLCGGGGWAASTSRSTRARPSFRRSRRPTSSSTATRKSPRGGPAPHRRRPSTRATSPRPRPPCSAAQSTPPPPLPRPHPLPNRLSRESQVTCRSRKRCIHTLL